MKPVLLRSCALLFGFGVFFCGSAYADISCSVSTMSNTSFGNIQFQPDYTDSTATYNYTCYNNGALPWSARICLSIGVPAGGGTVGSRLMRKGTDQLGFQLYKDSGRSDIWGSQFSGSNSPYELTLDRIPAYTTWSGSIPIYGRVLGNQTSVIPGAYNSTYASGDTAYTIKTVINAGPPSGCDTTIRTARAFPFTISATVQKECTVSASPLNFGTNLGLLNSSVNASTTLAVQCSNTTPYNVGLNAGQNGGGNINARKMILGGNSVGYQLYRDLARTQVWGNTVGTNTVAGTGNGNTQNLSVYGTVPVQTTPPAGTYSDTIVVTVTY